MSNQSTVETTHDHFYDSKPWLQEYAPGVPHELPAIPYKNIGHMLYSAAAKHGEKTSFSTCLPNGFAGQISYAEHDKLSNDFAAYLRLELGLKKGDRVAVQMPNCLTWPIVAAGIMKSGCVLVNINPLYTESEMEHAFNDSGAKVLVIIDLFANKLEKVIPRTQVRHIVLTSVAEKFPFLLKGIVKLKMKLTKMVQPTSLHVTQIEEALQLGSKRVPASQDWDNAFLASLGADESGKSGSVNLDDIAVLQLTGGTTGRSKAAMLTHRNLLTNAMQIEAFGKPVMIPGKEVLLTALPLYHIFAFSANFLVYYHIGSHNVMVPSPRPLTNLKKVFEKYAFTSMTGVNTLYAGLTNEEWFKANPPKSLRFCIAGGAALQGAVAKRWQEVVGCEVAEGYGLTETSPVVTFNPTGGGDVRAGTIGVPMPSTDVRVIDDNGNTVALGERGEIVVKGGQVMKGYWNRPDATDESFKGEWLLTGDVAVMDERGFFRIVDRKKEMILVSGFNVYPNEVEDCIATHPDVLESAVIGIPHENSGEAVRAYVVCKPGKTMNIEQLRNHCKETMTSYKLPKELILREELPKTPIGKILRKDLRAEAAEERKKS